MKFYTRVMITCAFAFVGIGLWVLSHPSIDSSKATMHALFAQADIQFIGGNVTRAATDPWIDKHIFPNGVIPTISDIGRSVEGLFVMEDWHNFGPHYDTTLLAWYANFNKNWGQLSDKYGASFYRMWKYYLLACAGSFRARDNQLWQVVFSKKGAASAAYVSAR